MVQRFGISNGEKPGKNPIEKASTNAAETRNAAAKHAVAGRATHLNEPLGLEVELVLERVVSRIPIRPQIGADAQEWPPSPVRRRPERQRRNRFEED